MLSRTHNWVRPNRFYRWVAVFFLVFTVCDLALPARCSEDGSGSDAVTAVSEDRSGRASLDAAPAGQSEGQNAPNAEGHDCFCCCAHLTVTAPFHMADLALPPEVVPRSYANLPAAPPHFTYRPPRLA